MKIKRFVAPDMRQAMREVREEQGPDAVILSTRRLDEGIEIIAAVDYDEALVREAARHGAPLPMAEPAPARARGVTSSEAAAAAIHSVAAAPKMRAAPGLRSEEGAQAAEMDASERLALAASVAMAARRTAAESKAKAKASPSPLRQARDAAQLPSMDSGRSSSPAVKLPGEREQKRAPSAESQVRRPEPVEASNSGSRDQNAAAQSEPRPVDPLAIHPLVERAAQDTVRMRAELGSMREMLELQLSSLAWNDLERRQPLRARVLRELTRLGIEPDVARLLADELPEQLSAEQARYLPLGMLSRSVAVSGQGRSDLAGVTALVGPTGVGKTTTIAKLAAKAVLRHGASQVALVSTDHYRIGAAAQLEHYGRLLGVRVYPAYDAHSLAQVLELLRGSHTVLVDTAGVAGNDPRLAEQLETLKDFNGAEGGNLRACLVLAANAQAQSLEEAVRAYLPLQPHACILTKLDEAPSLGGALSVVIRHKLALDYTTDGQRVPEDIAAADARVLVCRAANVLKEHAPPVDDALLAERFGFAAAGA